MARHRWILALLFCPRSPERGFYFAPMANLLSKAATKQPRSAMQPVRQPVIRTIVVTTYLVALVFLFVGAFVFLRGAATKPRHARPRHERTVACGFEHGKFY